MPKPAPSWCTGAPHPEALFSLLIFDLTTGEEINLRTRLPQDLRLLPLYLSLSPLLPQDCKPVIETNGEAFDIWPAQDGLHLQPRLARVDRPCADEAVIPLSRMRALDFDAGLIAAFR